jgi:hypothetical protein
MCVEVMKVEEKVVDGKEEKGKIVEVKGEKGECILNIMVNKILWKIVIECKR